MKWTTLEVKNDLAKALRLNTPFSRVKKEQCNVKIKHYADWLSQNHVKSVMLLSTPTLDAVCLCYALVLCNKTYIPVHTSTSPELLEIYLQTYQVDLLLIQPQLSTQFENTFKNKLIADKENAFLYYFPQTHHTFCLLPGMILFTSGTTGFPKAVYYQYNTLYKYISWCINEFNLKNDDNFLFTSELAFVASLRPLFVPVLAEANIIFLELNSANKLKSVMNALLKDQITVVNLTPSFFKILVQHIEKTQNLHALASIRLILLSGEPIDIEVINNWFFKINPNTVFYNLYGTTECLVPFYKKFEKPIQEHERLHLGQLRTGCDYKLLADVNKGYELCISGDTATAYFDEQLTRNNFIIINNSPYIKTNDFVKLENKNHKKELFFGSRAQRIIKRYGQLIYLDQIENTLTKQHSSLNFIVFADEEHENKIYLIIHGSLYDDMLLKQVKRILKTHFPSYMHPGEYIFVKDLPLTASGKINYSLIKEHVIYKQTDQIADYFKRFFHEKPIDMNARIIDLGLESIDYIEIADAFFKTTGKWLDISKITNTTRLANIASCFVDLDLQKSTFSKMVSINPIQRAHYSKELDYKPGDDSSCFIASYCLKENIDLNKLEVAIAETLANHFMLGSKLEWINNDYFFVRTPVQTDFRLKAPIFFAGKALAKLKTSVHSDRLVRMYLQKKKSQYFLIIAYHHIALDGWSLALVREEIFRRYAGVHKVKHLNASDEIDSLNKVNEISIHNNYSIKELKSRLSQVNPYEYNQLHSIFNDTLQKNHTCFSLEKDRIDRFARKNQINECPYSVLFALMLHQIIAQLAGVNKLFFYISFSNRNLPVANIKELVTNMATGLPVFFDDTNLTLKEFASQIKDDLTLYFKNMSYAALKEIWDKEIIGRKYLSYSEQPYRIVFTYVNEISGKEYIQDKYIDWNASTNQINPGRHNNHKKKGIVFLRIYNMNTHFVVMLNTQMKKEYHDYLNNRFKELMVSTLPGESTSGTSPLVARRTST